MVRLRFKQQPNVEKSLSARKLGPSLVWGVFMGWSQNPGGKWDRRCVCAALAVYGGLLWAKSAGDISVQLDWLLIGAMVVCGVVEALGALDGVGRAMAVDLARYKPLEQMAIVCRAQLLIGVHGSGVEHLEV